MQTSHCYIFLILQHFEPKFVILIISSCSFKLNGIRSSCLDQNLVYSWLESSIQLSSHLRVGMTNSFDITIKNFVTDEEVTRREVVSWNYVHTVQDNGAYAQRYLTGKVTCTDEIRKKKEFEFTVGSDGEECFINKKKFCNGKLLAEKKYRYSLLIKKTGLGNYFLNNTKLACVQAKSG